MAASFDFRGQCVFITGGSMGIGASLVEEFARAGASIVFTHNTHSERATALVERLRAQHPRVVVDTIFVDLSDIGAAACSVQLAVELLGGRLDIGTLLHS
jgi:NAD(P)-dependent dehydrogenase (short-subunit alcohol dehydrogenase family)